MPNNDNDVSSSDYYPGIVPTIMAIKDILAQNIETVIVGYNSVAQTFSAIADTIGKLMSEEFSESMLQSIEAINTVLNSWSSALCDDTKDVQDCITLDEKALESLQEVIPFFPEEKQDEFQEAITPKFGERTKELSVQMICQIITWILMILSLLSSVPDSETKDIMREQIESTNKIENSLGHLAEAIENSIKSVDNRNIEVTLNVNIIGNGDDTILEIVDDSDEFVVPESQNSETQDQRDVQEPQP